MSVLQNEAEQGAWVECMVWTHESNVITPALSSFFDTERPNLWNTFSKESAWCVCTASNSSFLQFQLKKFSLLYILNKTEYLGLSL